MPNKYRVSIRIEGIMTGGRDGATGYALSDGIGMELDKEHLLKVRSVQQEGIRGDGIHVISDPITYLDIDVTAISIDHAVPMAITIARRFIALVAFTDHYNLQINLIGGIPIVLLPDMINLSPSTYVMTVAGLASLENVKHVWETLSEIDRYKSNTLELALEWIHIGLTEDDDKAKFLAYWISLELLLRDNESATLKIFNGISEDIKKNIRREIEDVLSKYSAYFDIDKRTRLVNSLINTDAEKPTKRWSKALNEQGVSCSEQELESFYKIRNTLTHRGSNQNFPEVNRLKEVVTQYANQLLQSYSRKTNKD